MVKIMAMRQSSCGDAPGTEKTQRHERRPARRHCPPRSAPRADAGDPKGRITTEAGLEGDFKGGKYPFRQITVLAREDWEEALAELGAPDLPWTARRANLLVAGVALPRAKGGLVRIGPVLLEVTGQTYPCARMEEARRAPQGAGKGPGAAA